MDEFEEQYQEPNQNGNWESAARISADRWLVIAVVALLVVSGIALVYGYRQRAMVNQLTAQAGTTTQAMNQLQAQVSTLTDRLNEMTPKQSAATSQPAATLDAQTSAEAPSNITEVTPAPAAKPAPAKRATANRHTPSDKRDAQLQTQLTEQQKKLNDMQEQAEKNRSDLEGNINSTPNHPNESIPKPHNELL